MSILRLALRGLNLDDIDPVEGGDPVEGKSETEKSSSGAKPISDFNK